MNQTSSELEQLQKRARRRIVGAVFLLLISSSVLWTVLDHLPDQPMTPERVEIEATTTNDSITANQASVPFEGTMDQATATQETSSGVGTEIISVLEENVPHPPLLDHVPVAAVKPAPTPATIAPVAPKPAVKKEKPKEKPADKPKKEEPKPKPKPKAEAKPEAKPVVKPEPDPNDILNGIDPGN